MCCVDEYRDPGGGKTTTSSREGENREGGSEDTVALETFTSPLHCHKRLVQETRGLHESVTSFKRLKDTSGNLKTPG